MGAKVSSFRFVMAGALVACVVVFALSLRGRQFVWLETTQGAVAIGGDATSRREGEHLVVSLIDAGASVELLVPARVQASAHVPVSIVLRDANGSHAGDGLLRVDSVGAFIEGRLSLDLEGREMSGRLRVKSGAPVAPTLPLAHAG